MYYYIFDNVEIILIYNEILDIYTDIIIMNLQNDSCIYTLYLHNSSLISIPHPNHPN